MCDIVMVTKTQFCMFFFKTDSFAVLVLHIMCESDVLCILHG